MTKYNIQKDDTTITFDNALDLFIYDTISAQTEKDIKEKAELTRYLYLKGDIGTPLGELCDFVANQKNYDVMKDMHHLEALNYFFMNYECPKDE